MKIYCNDYTLEDRTPRTVYVSQYSSYKVGIKVTKAGVAQSPVKLFCGDAEISADASLFNGYVAFSMTAGASDRKEYRVNADGVDMKLYINTTESTVAELNDKDTVFELPIASASTLGGVKINGNNLAITNDGTLSAGGGSLPSNPTFSGITVTNDDMYSISLGSNDLTNFIYLNGLQVYLTANVPIESWAQKIDSLSTQTFESRVDYDEESWSTTNITDFKKSNKVIFNTYDGMNTNMRIYNDLTVQEFPVQLKSFSGTYEDGTSFSFKVMSIEE